MRLFALLLLSAASLAGQRFYLDDPLDFEPPPRPVKNIQTRKLSDFYDFFVNTFGSPGEHQPKQGPKIRARGISTLDEPMQGAWWVKRHYYRRMSIDELKRIPTPDVLPAMDGKWTIVSAKKEGVTPGFVIVDKNQRRFFVKFDPLSNPEMATTADAVTTRFFYAMGYHVPDNNIVYFHENQLQLGTTMRTRDLFEILRKVHQEKDGTYRATMSLALPGETIGPPLYYGTRPDDPNDVVPHEHRRDQRGLFVIDAWVDHDDSRAINNLDIIATENGRPYIKHYQLDLGSTLGSGTERPNNPRSGAALFSWKASVWQLLTLGLVPPYWQFAEYPDFPSIGLFEWKVFDPERWVPEYPNTAFANRLPDDEFWGAKLVTAFTDAEIRAIVSMGKLTDKLAEDWLVECLSRRRDKIGRTYFTKVLPLDKFAIANGELAWEDLGASLKYLPAADVTIQWFQFDNNTGAKNPIAGATSRRVPAGIGYTCATITDTAKPSHTVDVFVRAGTQVVGVERHW